MAVKAQFIAGQWQAGSGATMSKLAPEDQSLLWQAASAGADDVQAARAAARAAFYPWSHRPLAERIDVVQRFAALLGTHKEALATLISRETSKPLWETRTEVQAMIGKWKNRLLRSPSKPITSGRAFMSRRCRTVKRCCATNRTA